MAGGPLSNKRGHVLVTNDRVIVSDNRFGGSGAGGIGGPLAGMLADALQRRQSGKPPILEFAMSDVTRVGHEKKLTVRDILLIEANGQEHRFAQGFKQLAPVLRRVLTERHGKNVVEDGEGFRVS